MFILKSFEEASQLVFHFAFGIFEKKLECFPTKVKLLNLEKNRGDFAITTSMYQIMEIFILYSYLFLAKKRLQNQPLEG